MKIIPMVPHCSHPMSLLGLRRLIHCSRCWQRDIYLSNVWDIPALVLYHMSCKKFSPFEKNIHVIPHKIYQTLLSMFTGILWENLKYQDRHITLSFQNSGPTVRTGQGKLDILTSRELPLANSPCRLESKRIIRVPYIPNFKPACAVTRFVGRT